VANEWMSPGGKEGRTVEEGKGKKARLRREGETWAFYGRKKGKQSAVGLGGGTAF